MKLTISKSKNATLYYVQKSYRTESGKSSTRTVERLGTIEEVEARLDSAYTAGIMNNFDINKYLIDKAYREKVKDYYGLLAGTINIFDMLDNLPTYQANLDCLTFLVVSNKLADKSRFI